jgi:hypothetical protein
MGADAIARVSGVGGSTDPAMSTLQTYAGVTTYYAIPPFASSPRDLNPNAWQCLSYKKNTSGLVRPTHTSVIFRRVKQHGDANPTVGSFVFDISQVFDGETMYVIADGDGSVANPWGVAIAIFVIRSTSGNLSQILDCPPGSNVWDGGPEIVAWDDLSVQTPGYPAGTLGVDPNISLTSLLDYSAFCFTAGLSLPFTTAWWVPDGPGSADLAWPPDGKTWGFPSTSAAGSRVDARMFTYNVQIPLDTPPLYPIVAHSVADVFMMQILADAARPLTDVGTVTPAGVPSYGTRDLRATRVRPQFVDQRFEGGGGIWLETHNP